MCTSYERVNNDDAAAATDDDDVGLNGLSA